MANARPPDEPYGFEIGPIRPPSEAFSLLIRVMRNCAWNRCLFCPVYKESEFSVRPVDHVKRDISLVHKYVTQFSGNRVLTPTSSPEEGQIFPGEALAFDSALSWYRNGMKSVFLQDADALVIEGKNLADILTHLRHMFPDVKRITSYSRSSTVNKIPGEDLTHLRNSGLNRIHIGLESGSDEVLRLVKKGASKKIHVQAGLKVKGGGMELSEYVMPGLGGRILSHEHALESADALNRIDPHFIRLRPLALPLRAPLYNLVQSGEFEPCNDVEVAREIRWMIEGLDGISSMLVSDHILNLFGDLNGKMPDDKTRLLNLLDSFLNLDEEKQTLYRFGRRLGVFTSLQDLSDARKVSRVENVMKQDKVGSSNIDEIIEHMMRSFV